MSTFISPAKKYKNKLKKKKTYESDHEKLK